MEDADLSEGYVRLFRCLTRSPVFADPILLKVWIWCLIKAQHAQRSFTLKTGRGAQVVTVDPGQFIFGRHSAAEVLTMPESTVRNKIQKLVEDKCLDRQVDSHYSLITICNWERYQQWQSDNGQPVGQAKDKQRTSKGQAKDTYNNVLNVPNVLNAKSTTLAPTDAKPHRSEPSPVPCPSMLSGLELYEKDPKLCKGLTDGLIKAWEKAYPGVNLAEQIAKAHAWELANPSKQKVNRIRFLTSWLARAQDAPRRLPSDIRESADTRYPPGKDPKATPVGPVAKALLEKFIHDDEKNAR